MLFQAAYVADYATTTALGELVLEVGGYTLPFEHARGSVFADQDYCWDIDGSVADSGFDLGSTLAARIVSRASQPTAEIVSRPRDGTAYRSAETISVLLSFEEDVRVSGSPQLQLEIGAQTRLAAYVPARRGRIAAFDYTVTADDAGSDGVSIRANTDASSPSLLLNGGAFRWVSFLRGQVVHLGFGAVSASSVHAVAGADADTTAPTLSAATIRFRRLVLTYSEPLHDDPQMMSGVATSSWSVTVNDAAVALASVTIGGERVTMELLSAVDHDDVVTVSSSVLMQDRAATPNVESALLDGRSVTNETPATKPVVAIAAGAGAYFEEESIMLTVSRSGEAADRLVVFLDYSQPRLLLEDPRVVVLEAGETSAQVAVPTKRRRPAGDRLLVIALLEDDAYDIGDPGSASVTVKDADASPVRVYTASKAYQDEPTSDRITNWIVKAVALEESGVPPEFRFLFSTESGTAEKNKDYRALDHRIGFSRRGLRSRTVSHRRTGCAALAGVTQDTCRNSRRRRSRGGRGLLHFCSKPTTPPPRTSRFPRGRCSRSSGTTTSKSTSQSRIRRRRLPRTRAGPTSRSRRMCDGLTRVGSLPA